MSVIIEFNSISFCKQTIFITRVRPLLKTVFLFKKIVSQKNVVYWCCPISTQSHRQETREQETFKTVYFTQRTSSEKAKTILSAAKAMAIVFQDSQGMIYTDDCRKAGRLQGSSSRIIVPIQYLFEKTRPHLAQKKWLFRHENAPAHTYAVTRWFKEVEASLDHVYRDKIRLC